MSINFPYPEMEPRPLADKIVARSYRTLACLVYSMTLPSRSLPSYPLRLRCNPRHLVTLQYSSDRRAADFRAFPLLGEVLRCTVRLRHIVLDIPIASIPVMLDIFRRYELIITPTRVRLEPTDPRSNRITLPCLDSIRSTRLAIVDALMRHRSVSTVVLDVPPNDIALAKFLRPRPDWNALSVRRLSMVYTGAYGFELLAEAILTSFPRLEHMAITVGSSNTQDMFNVSGLFLMQLSLELIIGDRCSYRCLLTIRVSRPSCTLWVSIMGRYGR